MQNNIQIFRSLWGLSPISDWNATIKSLAAEGFNGIEASLGDLQFGALQSNIFEFQSIIKPALDKYGMKLIVGVYSSYQDYEVWENKSLEEHVSQMKHQLDIASQLAPVHVNCHSGQDSFTIKESRDYFAQILLYQKSSHPTISISHETHRSRILYSPWTTLDLLREFPDLMLTLDFSHWTVVCERLLDTKSDKLWLNGLSVLSIIITFHRGNQTL